MQEVNILGILVSTPVLASRFCKELHLFSLLFYDEILTS